jgi:hypothetical protein
MRNKNRISRLAAPALLLTFWALMASSQEVSRMNAVPHVGDTVALKNLSGGERGLCMVSPGQMDRCADILANGVRYRIAFRKHTESRRFVCTYVHTDDPKFALKTLSVGAEVVAKSTDLIPSPGFEVYAPKEDDGWWPVVGFNGKVEVMTESGAFKSVSLAEIITEPSGNRLTLHIIGFTRR